MKSKNMIGIVLAGGVGTRMKSTLAPKQYLRVGGKMILTYSLETMLNHPMITSVYIVAVDSWHNEILHDLQQDYGKRICFAEPGATRQLSIWNALQKIWEDYEDTSDLAVLIHDGVRPNLTPEMITACGEALAQHDGVMPVLPMKDTVYYSEDGKCVSGLLNRSSVFAGQAPEGFRYDLYMEANRRLLPDQIMKINGSTEPAIMAGMDVAMIPGDENDFKITTPQDLKRFQEQFDEYSKDNENDARLCTA